MQMSDVIADMLTRIRNANNAKHATVDIPASNMKKSIADILVEEGYIKKPKRQPDRGICSLLYRVASRNPREGMLRRPLR